MLYLQSTGVRLMAATSPRVGISTVKDINNIPKFMAAVPEILGDIAEEVGQYLENKLVDKITKQDPSWVSLSPVTIRRKKSSKAWIDTGELIGLITHTIEGSIPVSIQVGIFDHEKAFIAYCLEFGTNGGSIVAGGMIHTWNHIPERPLFRLVFDEEKEAITAIIRNRWNTAIDKFFVQ